VCATRFVSVDTKDRAVWRAIEVCLGAHTVHLDLLTLIDLIDGCGIHPHLYADDTQIQCSCCRRSADHLQSTLSACLDEVSVFAVFSCKQFDRIHAVRDLLAFIHTSAEPSAICCCSCRSTPRNRVGFSLKEGPIQQNVGPLPVPNKKLRIARLNSHDTRSDSVVIVDILLRTRITIYDGSAPHKIVFLLLFQLGRISGMLLCCKNLPVLLWGPGPFLWGPYSAEHAEHA